MLEESQNLFSVTTLENSGEVVVGLHLNHPKVLSQKLCPVVHRHHHLSILCAGQLCSVDYVNDVLEGADKSSPIALLQEPESPVWEELCIMNDIVMEQCSPTITRHARYSIQGNKQ